MHTITAGDFTVELDISTKMFQYFKEERYERDAAA